MAKEYVRTILKECPMCGVNKSMQLTKDDIEGLEAYESGVLIQSALPLMNPMEREFIITGYCPRCQTMLFGTTYTSDRIL